MKKNLKKLFMIILLSHSSFSFSQDFILKCEKYYSGSNGTDTFNISVSKDRSSGFFIYDEKEVFKLNLTSKTDTYYEFATVKFLSINDYYVSYKEIRINRQNLTLTTVSEGDSRSIECNKDNTDIQKTISDIRNKRSINKQRKANDDLLHKEQLQKNSQF